MRLGDGERDGGLRLRVMGEMGGGALVVSMGSGVGRRTADATTSMVFLARID